MGLCIIFLSICFSDDAAEIAKNTSRANEAVDYMAWATAEGVAAVGLHAIAAKGAYCPPMDGPLMEKAGVLLESAKNDMTEASGLLEGLEVNGTKRTPFEETIIFAAYAGRNILRRANSPDV